MLGVNVDTKDAKQIAKLLNKIANGRMKTAYFNIAMTLSRRFKQTFRDQKDIDGNAWAPIKEQTKKRKKSSKILVQDGLLSSKMWGTNHGEDFAEVGSGAIYAAVHQFGAKKGEFGNMKSGRPIPWGDIPARPFLGWNDDLMDTTADVLKNFIASEIERNTG